MRVLVTRPADQAAPLLDALRADGFDPVACPLLEIEPIDDGPIDVREYDWVVVTSANGAAELVKRRLGNLPRVAAIGESTARALRQHGVAVDFVPRVSTQEGLVAEFPRPVGRALFVGAAGARRVIASELPADFRAVYRTRALRPDPLPRVDMAIVTSASAANAFAALAAGVPVVSIGPRTTSAAAGAGLHVVAEAAAPTVEGLVAAVRSAAG